MPDVIAVATDNYSSLPLRNPGSTNATTSSFLPTISYAPWAHRAVSHRDWFHLFLRPLTQLQAAAKTPPPRFPQRRFTSPLVSRIASTLFIF